LIASTGVNVDKLLTRLGDAGPGVGGPFIPAGPDAGASRAMPASLGSLDRHLERLDDMRKLASFLPLAAPSAHYYIASEFGRRRDPLNRRWAMHYGVDLAGVHRSPVLATAPGVVVSAGWNGNYGRMVEIDHGMGIRTRYGHLRRFVVKKGQRVELCQKIGEMGSSGRSTGTHLHYELLVNGQPRNPVKFLQAGEYVLKGF
jgi:murein DD-endopeptidase MepM/ murein hydrolase activator NlpD